MGRPFTTDENDELTGETVAKALRHFRTDVLMKQRWDHRKGASLRTYFIGQCLIRFPNIYRRWRAGEVRNRLETTEDEELLDFLRGGAKGPEKQVVAGITSSQAMASVKDPRVRKAMHMRAQGWTQTDIAEVLGVTEKTVERMFANERQRLKKRGFAS